VTVRENIDHLSSSLAVKEHREHEVDEVEWQGDRVCLHLGVRRDQRTRPLSRRR